MNKSRNPSKTFNLTIDKLVYGGAGLGRHKGKVIFVPLSVPGDRLLVRTVEEKNDFARAEIVKILEPGVGRVAPVCPYFGKCGGCHWQQLDYSRQVETKRQILEEIFYHRLPKTRDLPITMRACTHPLAYRSRARMQLQGSGSRSSVGFFRSGSHAVEDVKSCPLLRATLNKALTSLRLIKLKDGFDPGIQEIDLASSEEENTWTVAPIKSDISGGIPALPETSAESDAVILRRKIGQFIYSVTASVFFQANDFMVSELVTLVQEAAKSAGRESVLDLFAGVGLFSLPLARQFRKVVAVDSSPFACRLGSISVSAAGITHIQTICADVYPWMKSCGFNEQGQFDLIVLDPPRTGAGVEVMQQIREWAPKSIIYVSCDPQTLCRDLFQISARDYEIDLVEGLDMFPQTYHFETVVRLTKQ